MGPLDVTKQPICVTGTDLVLTEIDLNDGKLNYAKLTVIGSLTIHGTAILLHHSIISAKNLEIRATKTVDLRGAQIEAENSITISAQEILTDLSTSISAGGFVTISPKIIEIIKTT